MIIEKFNESLDNKRFPYEILNGELIKTIESKGKIFLTDTQYDKLKGLATKTKEAYDNYDKMKETQVEILKSAIHKVISDSK